MKSVIEEHVDGLWERKYHHKLSDICLNLVTESSSYLSFMPVFHVCTMCIVLVQNIIWIQQDELHSLRMKCVHFI